MNNATQIILTGIARDIAYWSAPERISELQAMPMGDWGTPQRLERGNFHMAVKDATEGDGLVRIDLFKWHGAYTESQRVMLGRAMKRMERDGLITRHALQGLNERYTHVRLTEAGAAAAAELQATEGTTDA